jgi:hypothetical protein
LGQRRQPALSRFVKGNKKSETGADKSRGRMYQGGDTMTGNIARREFLTGSALLAGAAATGVFTAVENASAAPVATPVSYQVKGRPFEGMIVYDDSVKTKRPVIFMQPDWMGVDADNIAQARLIAGKDYVVLVADMFGQGYANKTKTRPDLFAAVNALHDDLAFTLACSGTACDTLMAEANKLGLVETGKTVAIGYCGAPVSCSSRRGLVRISRRWSHSMSPIRTRRWRARPATSRAGCWRSTVRPTR